MEVFLLLLVDFYVVHLRGEKMRVCTDLSDTTKKSSLFPLFISIFSCNWFAIDLILYILYVSYNSRISFFFPDKSLL